MSPFWANAGVGDHFLQCMEKINKIRVGQQKVWQTNYSLSGTISSLEK